MNDVELDDRGLSIKMIQQRLVYTHDKSFKYRLYTENSWVWFKRCSETICSSTNPTKADFSPDKKSQYSVTTKTEFIDFY